jgi:plastin-1
MHHLYEDVRSGVLLLKVIDKVKPGSVDWKKVDFNNPNKFKKVINCNEAVDACKKAGLSIVGIGGTDIHDANKKLILGIVWQLMKHHTLQVLGGKTEDDLLKWANDIINKNPRIATFKDKSLSNSLFFIDVMAGMEPRAVDWELVIKEDTPEAIENNAKYAISIARKLGASIFIVWEDIKEVKPRMLMTFVAGLYDVYLLENKLKTEKSKFKTGEQNIGLDD